MSPAELRVMVAIVVAALVATVVCLATALPAGPPAKPFGADVFRAPSDVTVGPEPGCPAWAKSNGVGTDERAVAQ